MVVIITNVISWTEANVCSVSGRIASLIVMSMGTGIATNPPFVGHYGEIFHHVLLYVIALFGMYYMYILYSTLVVRCEASAQYYRDRNR